MEKKKIKKKGRLGPAPPARSPLLPAALLLGAAAPLLLGHGRGPAPRLRRSPIPGGAAGAPRSAPRSPGARRSAPAWPGPAAAEGAAGSGAEPPAARPLLPAGEPGATKPARSRSRRLADLGAS